MAATRSTSTGSISFAPGNNPTVLKRSGVIASILLIALAVPVLAAPDDSPPKIVIKSGDALQEGVLGDFCWGADEGQVGCTGPQEYDWPPAERTAAGKRARVRIKRNDRPDQLTLEYWREVDEAGQPSEGTAIELEYRLVKREREKGSVWDVWFRLPEEPGHFYLDLTGRWRDNDDGGEASYWFHLRLQ
jgi:hypothetical protein